MSLEPVCEGKLTCRCNLELTRRPIQQRSIALTIGSSGKQSDDGFVGWERTDTPIQLQIAKPLAADSTLVSHGSLSRESPLGKTIDVRDPVDDYSSIREQRPSLAGSLAGSLRALAVPDRSRRTANGKYYDASLPIKSLARAYVSSDVARMP